MSTVDLSIRLSSEAHRVLAESASTRDAAGASALARDILERCAAETQDTKIRASAERIAEHLRTHPDWADDPAHSFRTSKATNEAGRVVIVNSRDAQLHG